MFSKHRYLYEHFLNFLLEDFILTNCSLVEDQNVSATPCLFVASDC
jgi:hypothetical protein